MPVMRPTANSIWRSFQTRGKKHLVLTGASGSGKTTLLASLFSSPMPGVTSWVVPEKGVYLKNNCSKEIIQIGRYHPDPTHKRNQMKKEPHSYIPVCMQLPNGSRLMKSAFWKVIPANTGKLYEP